MPFCNISLNLDQIIGLGEMLNIHGTLYYYERDIKLTNIVIATVMHVLCGHYIS